MWFLKSPINNQPVRVEKFLEEANQLKSGSNTIKLIYEKLCYMIQMDNSLVLLIEQINYMHEIKIVPEKFFTLSKYLFDIQIGSIHTNKDDDGQTIKDFPSIVSLYTDNIDKIKYRESYIDVNKNEETNDIKYFNWRYFEPEILILDFINKNINIFNNLYKEQVKEKYKFLENEVYLTQQKIAKTIFKEIDESDKEGFREIFNNFYSIVIQEDRYIYEYFKIHDNYEYLIKYFPLFYMDMDYLINIMNHYKHKPYIFINKDLSLKWNTKDYNLNSWADYFTLVNKESQFKKEVSNHLQQVIFPQFKDENIKISNSSRYTNKGCYEFIASLPSFYVLYKNKKLKGWFDYEKETLMKIRKEQQRNQV